MSIDEFRDRMAEIVKAAHPQWVTSTYVRTRIPEEKQGSRVGVNLMEMDRQHDQIILNPKWYEDTRMDEKTYGLIRTK